MKAASEDSERLADLLQGLRREDVEPDAFDKGLFVCSKKGYLDAAAKLIIKGAKNFDQCTKAALRFRKYDVATLLLLCAAARSGDINAIGYMYDKGSALEASPSLLAEVKEPNLSEVRRALREGRVKTVHVINVALRAQQKEAAFELLRRTDCKRDTGHVDWHGLALRHIDAAWVLSVSSWVQRFILGSNGLTKVKSIDATRLS